MSNSFEVEGSADKLCAGSTAGSGPATDDIGSDNDDIGGGNSVWKPNIYLGSSRNTTVLVAPVSGTRFPAIVLGSSDFAIEMWLNFFGFANFDNDSTMGVGFQASGAGPFAYLSFVGGASPIRSAFADGGATDSGGFLTPPRGWHHWTINYDRSANMIVYLDGTAVDTTVISDNADSLGTLSFHPLAFDGSGTVGDITNGSGGFDLGPGTDPGGNYPESLTDVFTNYDFYHLPCAIGPVAVHAGAGSLVTATEMANSIKRRYVQNFTTLTQVLYQWTDIAFDNGHSWDFNRRHAHRGITDWPPYPIGIPRGVDSSIRVPNIATSGGDPLRLQTT